MKENNFTKRLGIFLDRKLLFKAHVRRPYQRARLVIDHIRRLYNIARSSSLGLL